MTGIIYKITNTINGKIYIGKTLETMEKRWKEHQRDSMRFTDRPLYKAMNKYGIKNFTIEVIEEPEIEILSQRECYWIEHYDSYHFGYNATLGGDGKVLYDYQQIVNKYREGALVKEIAKEFECSVDTVSKALRLAGLDPSTNSHKKSGKPVLMCEDNGIVIKEFSSRAEAATWLIEQGIAKTNDKNNVVAAIGRVVNGKRKSAYKKLWREAE